MNDTTDTNETLQAIIERLPRRDMIGAEDIASALGHNTSHAVVRAIATGRLHACRIGGRYTIARSAAITWLESTAVVADEAE